MPRARKDKEPSAGEPDERKAVNASVMLTAAEADALARLVGQMVARGERMADGARVTASALLRSWALPHLGRKG